MSRAYIGLGLPRFTKRTLISHMRRAAPDNKEVVRWIRRMRLAYKRVYKKEAPLTFDAMDLLNAWIAIREYGAPWTYAGNRKVKPCAGGVRLIFNLMLTPAIIEALDRVCSANDIEWGWQHGFNHPSIFGVLEKAKKKKIKVPNS